MLELAERARLSGLSRGLSGLSGLSGLLDEHVRFTTGRVKSGGRNLLVLNTGDDLYAVQVVDAATAQVTQTISYASPESLYAGVAFGPDGMHPYASAGGPTA